MDIPLIQTFLEVHRTRHFARAAETLHITQAAVSARIAQLEQLLGTPLFHRQRNNIRLTPAGERLLPHAEAAMTAWDQLLFQARTLGAGQGLVSFGCLPSIAEVFLDPWLAALRRQMPETPLQVELRNSTELSDRIRTGSLHFGLRYGPDTNGGLESLRLASTSLILVASRPVSEDALQDMDYVEVDWGPAYPGTGSPVLANRVRPALRVDSPRLAHHLLLSGEGIACLPLQQVAEDIDAGRLYRLGYAEPERRDIHAVFDSRIHGGRQPAALTLLQRIVQNPRPR